MHDAPSELADLLALHLVPGLGPRLMAALLEHFGSASAVRRASVANLADVPHIGKRLAAQFHHALQSIDPTTELEALARFNTQVLVRGQPGFPTNLVEIPAAPSLLYLRGTLLATDVNAVALVGSRRCTSYGKRVAQSLAAQLVRAGYTVISGLARGIDGAAHRGALQAGGRTLAVLAGGLARIYPPEHGELAAEVVSQGGLLSEAPMHMSPLAELFPARNRLISGLSRGVVVVEAAEQSGALITARHAAEQGRPVFAVPGPIDSPCSSGCHQLLRDGAVLVRKADDILEELKGLAPPTPLPTSGPPAGLDAASEKVWHLLTTGSRHLDELVCQLQMPVEAVSAALFQLELRRLVQRLPGNRFERC